MKPGLTALLIAGAMIPALGSAADVQFDPRLEVGVRSNDNYTLARPPGRQFEVAGGFADASAKIVAKTPRTTWELEPSVSTRFFPGDEQFETTDYRLSGGADSRGLKSRWGVRADFASEDVVQSEFPDADFSSAELGQGITADSGRFSLDNRRDLVSLRPYAEFDFTERTRLRIDASYLDVSFDRDFTFSQESYQAVGGGLTLRTTLSPASALGLAMEYQQVDPDVGAAKTDLQGLRLQWDYQLAERVTAYARTGARKSSFERGRVGTTLVPSAEKTTPLFGAGARWVFLRSELFVDLQREVDANSSGFVVRRDDLRVYYTHRFTTRLRGFGGAYFLDDESTASTLLYTPRSYSVLSAGMEWRFARSLALTGQIDQARQKFDTDRSASSNLGLRLALVYQPRRRD